jgi:hypothetical protein
VQHAQRRDRLVAIATRRPSANIAPKALVGPDDWRRVVRRRAVAEHPQLVNPPKAVARAAGSLHAEGTSVLGHPAGGRFLL